ncbi:MAG TPA: hypothetical protein VLG10_15635 [Methylomirabilota bacterium]|nr:hypothetical protein [Methylomirabilota bacterium]
MRVVATDPAAEATLGRDESFYLQIEYVTDEPISIWARPYFQGKPVARAKSNASNRYTGTGQALGWFSLDQADAVDEVRIKLGGGTPYREWEAASVPVRVVGTGQPAAERPRPAWVGELLAREEEQRRRDYEQRMSQPVSAGESALMAGFMLGVLGLLVGGLAWSAWGLWRWRGGWRVGAAVPAAVMAFVVLRIIIDTAIDPTSHNLWPFEILIYGSLSLAAMGVLALVRRLAGAHRREAG